MSSAKNPQIIKLELKAKPRKKAVKLDSEDEDSNTDDMNWKPEAASSKKPTKKVSKTIKTKLDIKPIRKIKRERENNTIDDEHCIEAGPSKKFKLKDENPTKSKKTIVDKDEPEIIWEVAEVLSYSENITMRVAKNLVQLLEEENTIPFIARYRRALTGDMEPEKLRNVKETFEELKAVKLKASNLIKQIEQTGNLTPEVKKSVLSAQSLSELEHVASPYKQGAKSTRAERARSLGLEKAAIELLWGTAGPETFPSCFIQPGVEGLDSESAVLTGFQNIMADVIGKDLNVLSEVRELLKQTSFILESQRSKSKAQSESGKASSSKVNTKASKTVTKKVPDESKFSNYFEFSVPITYVKPHQVLAINRGEKLKILSVKVVVPEFLLNYLRQFCESHFLSRGFQNHIRTMLFKQSYKDAYKRFIKPLLSRKVRAKLNKAAENASIDVFAKNLKNMLLTPPLKGRVVLGVDPGFFHGCKLAMVSPSGEVLHTDVIHPQFGKAKGLMQSTAASKLKNLILNFNCETVALGNGTACRETESFLGALIGTGTLSPLDVQYCIVSEQGASIYSCSPEAKKEFPNLNPNLISAVSIARRLQDPLAELVKVEPKHLGVGMYQHDLQKVQLKASLDEVVQECVSFVGVDINTASASLLRHVAGLSSSRAQNLLEWRSKNGAFTNRNQLLQVKGIGKKTFEQCAGFIRVMGSSSAANHLGKRKKEEDAPQPLDNTSVHPESYEIARKFIKVCNMEVTQLGRPEFIKKIKEVVQEKGAQMLSSQLGVELATFYQLVEALTQPVDHDLRSSLQKPLFRRGITSLEDVKPGTELTGQVQNVTHFGAFVDVGVGTNGLLHSSAMHGASIKLGDSVSVKVMSVDINRRRLALELL